MLDLAIGIAIGAAFSPFWMMVWNMAKAKVTSALTPQDPPAK
jgi:hypothetical protein